MTVTRESRRMSRVTPPEKNVTETRDVRRESQDPYPTPPYPTHSCSCGWSVCRANPNSNLAVSYALLGLEPMA